MHKYYEMTELIFKIEEIPSYKNTNEKNKKKHRHKNTYLLLSREKATSRTA